MNAEEFAGLKRGMLIRHVNSADVLTVIGPRTTGSFWAILMASASNPAEWDIVDEAGRVVSEGSSYEPTSRRKELMLIRNDVVVGRASSADVCAAFSMDTAHVLSVPEAALHFTRAVRTTDWFEIATLVVNALRPRQPSADDLARDLVLAVIDREIKDIS